MASDGAVNTAREFFGSALYESNAAHARASLGDVPATDEGLRMLAANGNWSEVLALARKLDAQVAAKAQWHPTRYATVSLTTPACVTDSICTATEKGTEAGQAAHSSSTAASSSCSSASPGDLGAVAPPLPTDAAVWNARLPYLLVQVTANLKMRRIVDARRIIDGLGDVEGEGFRHPVTGESFAPFSLRLIAALLPLYSGVPMVAQKKLYALLEECLLRERQCGEALREEHASGSSADNAMNAGAVKRLWCMWTQRVFRVQRTLLHVHVHTSQQSLARCVIEQALRIDDMWHKTFHLLSDDLYQLRHALHLQQVVCLALHIGDAQRAGEVHQAIRQMLIDLEAPSTPAPEAVLTNCALLALIVMSCDAFSAVFRGDFCEAVKLFRDVVARCGEAKKALMPEGLTGGSDEDLTSAADGTISERTLRWWVLQGICAHAQVSQVTCMAYCSDTEPERSMQDMCKTMEDYAKAEPQVLCNSDPFVESIVRLYALAGERRTNLERFSDLLEVFRCDRSSLPSLEALV
ncbi:hypothetical protein ABL78_2293 [Leptomonas seymouri]|uniref:Uncharacterized protein n=1 Tax=Leptomonas seymouri TaxID=5684 RepID=A0A0N1PCU4_LEPSE|nr:hypothetical protein ABL78_2293 [Leptomonas seymouri]|eukprot:KPI88625.1 hypothetical protein ABL78_2293 [Leptomonas seymouri]